MRKRWKIIIFMVMGILLIFGLNTYAFWDNLINPFKSAPRRNLLLIGVDTLRSDRVGVYGYKNAQTPNIDVLAGKGVLFKTTVSQAPITLVSFSSIMTGLLPLHHGVRDNGIYVLHDQNTTLAELFQLKGYKTSAIVGSFVLDHRYGLHQGFLHYDDFIAEQYTGLSLYPERNAQEVANLAIQEIRKSKNDPFFMFVHFFDPHANYNPPSPYKEKFKESPYDGEIAYTDYWIGQIINTLKQENLEDNTVIVLLSDHGESLGEHDEGTHGLFLYDATLLVPLIIKSPDLPANVQILSQVRLIDVVPTLIEMFHLSSIPTDGQSMLNLMKNPKSKFPSSAYSETYLPMNFNWSSLVSLRESNWKYIHGPSPELYHFVKDPDELINSVKTQPEQKNRLYGELQKILSTTLVTKNKRQPTEEEIERLRSIGYFHSSPGRLTDSVNKLPDPKEKIAVFKLIEEAENYISLGNVDKALDALNEAIKKDSANPVLYNRRGFIYQELGKWNEAIVNYQKEISIRPGNLEPYINLGNIYVILGKLDLSKQYYEKAIALNPKDANIYFNLGTLSQREGNLKKAKEYYSRGLELNPNIDNAWIDFGLVSIKLGDLVNAEKAFQKAVALHSKSYIPYYQLGLIYRENKDFKQAESMLRKAAYLNPRNPEIQNLLKEFPKQD